MLASTEDTRLIMKLITYGFNFLMNEMFAAPKVINVMRIFEFEMFAAPLN